MPELPEVETMVRGIRPFLEGAKLIDVSLPECPCRPILMQPAFTEIQRISTGSRIADVRRRAKRIVIELENEFAFVIEPRMSGLMVVQEPPTQQHLRFEWKLQQSRRRHSIWFWDRRGLGTLRLLTPAELAEQLGDQHLGPDALEMTLEHWRQRLKKTDRAIKVALLDQKLVAGIGNLYASEILHRSGIHPVTSASRISPGRLQKMHEATLEILQTAIFYEGSTLGDGTYRNSLNKDGSYQNQHRVYGKQGSLCPTCSKGIIQRIVQAQRSTFYCPKCQREG